jgi:hypothetical protein
MMNIQEKWNLRRKTENSIKHEQEIKGIREEMNQQFTTIMLMIQQNPLLAHIKPEALREKTKIK